MIPPTMPEQRALGERAALSDRLLTSFAGRRMHLELSRAELHGGGRVEGRVHLDRNPAQGVLRAGIRCLESWRVNPRPGRWIMQGRAGTVPLWRYGTLFEEWVELEPLDDAHWRGFSFLLPDGLPPAVEARSVAWRYEIEARRSVRFGPDDRALLTPLGYVDVLARVHPRADRRAIRTGARSG